MFVVNRLLAGLVLASLFVINHPAQAVEGGDGAGNGGGVDAGDLGQTLYLAPKRYSARDIRKLISENVIEQIIFDKKIVFDGLNEKLSRDVLTIGEVDPRMAAELVNKLPGASLKRGQRLIRRHYNRTRRNRNELRERFGNADTAKRLRKIENSLLELFRQFTDWRSSP